MAIQRLALVTVHASPLAPMGGKKTGGMNVYIRKLALELGQRGIEVDIFTRAVDPAQAHIDESLGSQVRVINITAGGTFEMGPDELFPHLSEFTAGVIAFGTRHNRTYDLIYSHYWLSGWVAHQLSDMWGIPFVHMFHTLGHMKDRIAASSQTPQQRIYVETQITAWASQIIAATPAEYAQLRWLYRANRTRISIISPGVDLEQFHPMSEAEAKQHIGVDAGTNLLLFVGRIEPLKAIDIIIEALYDLRYNQPDLLTNLQFVVIGGDPNDREDEELNRLRDMVTEYELDDHVAFWGARDQTQLPYYYAAAKAVLMPSDYESFGMVALEAMATGTPVIASAVGGLAYLVHDDQNGFLVPSRDPKTLAQRIAQLLREPEKHQAMRAAAANHARAYAWSAIGSALLNQFESVLSHQRITHHRR
jgi:D-inositol-3-phosphate glycosyltransferase